MHACVETLPVVRTDKDEWQQELRLLAKEDDTPIYTVDLDSASRIREEHLGFTPLEEMAEATGGRHLIVGQPQDLADGTSKIGEAFACVALQDHQLEWLLAEFPIWNGTLAAPLGILNCKAANPSRIV